ncbi:cation-transporting P-type ATPase [Nocardioides sp. cx-169]|uniref:cation-translocating P-type ATPase n=1 Tax=Nocardioides sp. cx-169 TaxID=2899080 RepID=UPI001E44342C|nr:cation-transporting P-type ATPase [Nocardioides sp. cx-169]MCD4535505.1 cation-transporting P-type ATPase [Nocardioides sp. cx-169]
MTITGLSSAEAAERLATFGPNRAPRPKPPSLVSRVGGQLRDPMILLLLGALVVVAALGDVADAIIIAAVIVLNTAIGVVQEVRAANAIASLERLSAPHATVLRDGEPVRVDSADLVPGDVVRLEAGDVVPADGSLLEAAALQVDEAAMTGESVPVARGVDEPLLSGTVVTRGRGLAEVTSTGADSALGRIAAAIASAGVRPTPLQQRLSTLSRQLVGLTLALAALVFVLGLLRGEGAAEMVVLAVSLAVAAIPESLPAVVSVALALGAYRMARQSALVRWLPAVETLGSVTVLASDKTGTLTEGRMVVQQLWTPTGASRVTGHGYDVAGEVVGDDEPESLALLLRDVVLCNDARLTTAEDGQWGIVGDPMEAALLIAAAKHDADLLRLGSLWSRVDEVPFDASLQRMITVHHRDGAWLTVCKGAPEVVLDLLADTDVAQRARAAAEEFAGRGFRVLAVADTAGASQPARSELDDGLVLRGLVAISDPLRADAAGVVSACADAGIRTVLITGDHPATARAIADELGIRSATQEVADGDMVKRGEHVAAVERIGVYARTHPEQKVDIVAAWQDRGEVVAMTGDGVNDAPALRRADIGVAMGERGTEVARQAADVVLADDNLRTVVVAVGEGRRIYANIRMFLRYALAGGLAEVVVILLGPFLGLAVPLGPGQILWINMLTHGVPGVAFGGEPLDPEAMRRPSPPPQQSVLGQGLFGQILLAGALISIVSLAAGLLAPEARVQTWVFVTLGLAQLGVGLAIRAPRAGVTWRGRGLEAAVALAAVLQVLAVTWSPLRSLLGTDTLSWSDAATVLLLSVVPGAVLAAQRHRQSRRRVAPTSLASGGSA